MERQWYLWGSEKLKSWKISVIKDSLKRQSQDVYEVCSGKTKNRTRKIFDKIHQILVDFHGLQFLDF